jgi:D-amino peptidase
MMDAIRDVRLNGRSLGELGLNAALAGAYGVPVALVSGDRATAEEARALLGPEIETVVVKEAVSRHAARSVAPSVARQLIRDGVLAALRRPHRPWVPPSPSSIEVDFTFSYQADYAELVPGSSRLSAVTVGYTHADFCELFRAWRAFYNLARAE